MVQVKLLSLKCWQRQEKRKRAANHSKKITVECIFFSNIDSWNEHQLQASNYRSKIWRLSQRIASLKVQWCMDDGHIYLWSRETNETRPYHWQLGSKAFRRVASKSCNYFSFGQGCWHLSDRWAISLFGQLTKSHNSKSHKEICFEQSKVRIRSWTRFHHVHIFGRPSYRIWRRARCQMCRQLSPRFIGRYEQVLEHVGNYFQKGHD